MFQTEHLQEKWQPVLEHKDLPEINDSYRKASNHCYLENQEKSMKEDNAFLSDFATKLVMHLPVQMLIIGIQSSSPRKTGDAEPYCV